MKKWNHVALMMWAFLGLVGYLIGDVTGAVCGVTIGIGISLIAEFF